MGFLKRFRIPVGREGGFSLAEVMMAGFILVIAVIPMVGMFDGAHQVSMAAFDINLSEECLGHYTEQVMNMPFYVPHETVTPPELRDVDDHYWGTRPTVYDNSWDNAPEVEMKALGAEPYKEMSVTIKMSYVDEEQVEGKTLAEAANATELSSDWEPIKLYGYDRPKTPTGKTLNLILYEIKVTTDRGRIITSTQLYASPTDVVANVYIDKVVNVSADASKKGTRDNEMGDCISAPHNKDSVTLRFYGEGFEQADVDAGLVSVELVRIDDNNISLTADPVYGEEGGRRYLEGTVNLTSGGKIPSEENPNVWYPRRKPGYWHAWLVVNHVISVKNDIFVVEYPEPVYMSPGSDFADSDGDKSGEESSTDEVLTLHNVDYVTDFMAVTYPNPGIGAVVQLVHTQNDPTTGEPIEIINGSDLVISPDAQQGYAQGLTVTAHFDFTARVGGDYYLRVINCIDRATPDIEVMGNTHFALDGGPYYYLEGPPAIYEAYVKGYVELPETYVESTTPQTRCFCYDEREYKYWLHIDGVNFDELVSLKLGIGAATPPDGDNVFEADFVDPIDEYTLEAVFDIAPNVAAGQYGKYWLYAENGNGFGAVLDPAIEIRRPAPIIYYYEVKSLGTWQNYYDIDVDIEGECFDVDAVAGTDFDVMILEAADPDNNWLGTEALDDPAASEYGRHVDCALNLVDCDTGQWVLYGLSQPAGLTDSGFTDTIVDPQVTYIENFNVTVGTPMLLTEGIPASGDPWSIRVTSRYRDWEHVGGVWQWSAWKAWQTSTEGNGNAATCSENDPDWPEEDQDWRTEGQGYLAVVRGIGFEKAGLSVHAANNAAPQGPAMDATWNAVPVFADRATLQVWAEMDETMAQTTGPNEGGYIRLQLMNPSVGAWGSWYDNRIRLLAQ